MKRNTSIHEYKDFDFQSLTKPEWYVASIEKLKGRCIWCGKKLPKRKRRYCSDICRRESWHSIHDLRVTSLRRYIHQRDKFECQKCGKHFSFFTPAGAELTYHSGHVHHIIPLYKGGADSHENMTLLCKECHKDKHRKYNESKKEI